MFEQCLKIWDYSLESVSIMAEEGGNFVCFRREEPVGDKCDEGVVLIRRRLFVYVEVIFRVCLYQRACGKRRISATEIGFVACDVFIEDSST